MTVRQIKFRLALCFALLTMGAGVQLPFLPLWLSDKGLGGAQVATVLAGSLVVRAIAQPLFAWAADRFQKRRLVVRICAVSSLAAMALLSQQHDPAFIAMFTWLAAFLFAPVFPLVESYSVDTCAAHGIDYGRMRLWASLSFLTGGLIAGYLLTLLPASDAIYLIVAGYCAPVAAAFTIPREATPHAHDAALQLDTSVWRFFFGSRFALMILAVSIAMSSHALLNGFSSVYWTRLGYDTFTISLFWTCAVMSEVFLFAFSQPVVKRLGTERLILFGIGGGVVRWVGMILASSVLGFALVSVLHILSFAMMHLGVMHFIRANVPLKLRNTVQGIYSALSGGVFMAGATMLSGPVFEKHGGEAFLLMMAISLFGFCLAWAAQTRD
jgi:MFS transporter, PPP family, 3-phenylpropionic acid transporter